jgi:hypothetical protein
MATIWLLKSGEIQRGLSAGSKSLDWCVENLGLRPSNRIAGLETRNLRIGEKEDPQRAPYRGLRHAVVQVDEADLQNKNDWKTGFYLLEKDATQVGKILDGK